MKGAAFELVRHTSAAAFVQDLSPTATHFDDGGDWIFRGQSRDLPLLPAAYREQRMLPIKRRLWDRWTNWQQTRAELKLIRRFYGMADRAGLQIPEDSYELRMLLATVDQDRDKFVSGWPPGQLWPLMALAQHHGVPTRLLDWTHSPYAAAYFAAEGALKEGAAADASVVVWAFDTVTADMGSDSEDEDDDAALTPTGVVELVTTPYGNNRNLAAQRGVHLLYHSAEPVLPDTLAIRDRFDCALQRAHSVMSDYGKALYKFILPRSEAGPLLRLLTKHGISGATLFPGFDGVARAMREEDSYRTRSRP
jgi:hypothetical protein